MNKKGRLNRIEFHGCAFLEISFIVASTTSNSYRQIQQPTCTSYDMHDVISRSASSTIQLYLHKVIVHRGLNPVKPSIIVVIIIHLALLTHKTIHMCQYIHAIRIMTIHLTIHCRCLGRPCLSHINAILDH